eukprot:Mrub_09707.p1 GENE.Mrub_09707~~Mrub_09707.p1  ORF type:complete len:211 (+),score=21.48 Mrub_09707:91-633(+)
MIKTLKLENLRFHYSNSNNYTAIVVTSSEFKEEVIFPLMSKIQNQFYQMTLAHSKEEITKDLNAVINFKDSLDYLINDAKKQHIDKLEVMVQGVEDIRNKTKANLDQMMDFQQKIDNAADRAEDLNSINKQLLRNSREIKRRKICEYYKYYITFGILLMIGMYILMAYSCGGYMLNKCIG